MSSNAAISRSDLLLGITTWSQQRRDNFLHLLRTEIDIDSVDDTSSPAYSQLAISLGSVLPPADVLLQLGRKARDQGVSCQIHEQNGKTTTGSYMRLPSYQGSTWKYPEHTFPDECRLDPLVAATFPDWADMSCALDSVLVIARAASLCTNQTDAITFAKWRTLSPIQSAFRMLMEGYYRSVERKALQKMKNILAMQLTSANEVQYTKGSYSDANEVAIHCFEGIYSMSYTRAIRALCCDGGPTTKTIRILKGVGEPRLMTSHSILLSIHGHKILPRERIERFLLEGYLGIACNTDPDWHRNPNRAGGTGNMSAPWTPCKPGCYQIINTSALVLDRPPPLLMVNIEGGDLVHDRQRGFFEPMTLVLDVVTRTAASAVVVPRVVPQRVTYAPVGAILYNAGHFTSVWKNMVGPYQKPILHVDCMSAKTPKQTSRWLAGVPTTAKIVTLFYERVFQAGQ